MPVSFNKLAPATQQAFVDYVRENVISSSGCYAETLSKFSVITESLVTALRVEQDYLFEEAMITTTLAFQVIGYDEVFYWTHKEKEECPF